MITKKLIIEVPGGLGNQLFAFFAGFYLAKSLNHRLIIDLLNVSMEHSKHYSLTSFELDAVFVNSKSNIFKKAKKTIRKISDSLAYRIPGFSTFREKTIRLYIEEPHSEYDSDLIWELKKLSEMRVFWGGGKVRLRGYFSTSRYLEMLQEQRLFDTCTLRNPSVWYRSLEEIALRQRPIMMHIRRGDLMSSIEHHGVLDEKYYEHALNLALDKYSKHPIWVFSDAIQEIQNWELFEGKDVFFVQRDRSSSLSYLNLDDPAEHLLLMSYGCANIVANSSFSLFGAMFNQNADLVICPQPITRNSNMNIQSFYPENWVRIPAVWHEIN